MRAIDANPVRFSIHSNQNEPEGVMLVDQLDTSVATETADEVSRKLDVAESQLAARMGLDRKRLRSEVIRMLRADELGDYDHDGLVSDWLYFRTAVADWAATSSRSPEEAPPPTDRSDSPTSQGPLEAALAASGVRSCRHPSGSTGQTNRRQAGIARRPN
jgi:hypothetical protein